MFVVLERWYWWLDFSNNFQRGFVIINIIPSGSSGLEFWMLTLISLTHQQLPVRTTSWLRCQPWRSWSLFRTVSSTYCIKPYLAPWDSHTMGGWCISGNSRGGLGQVFASGSFLFHLCCAQTDTIRFTLTEARLSGIYENVHPVGDRCHQSYPTYIHMFWICTICGESYSVYFHKLSHSLPNQ